MIYVCGGGLLLTLWLLINPLLTYWTLGQSSMQYQFIILHDNDKTEIQLFKFCELYTAYEPLGIILKALGIFQLQSMN